MRVSQECFHAARRPEALVRRVTLEAPAQPEEAAWNELVKRTIKFGGGTGSATAAKNHIKAAIAAHDATAKAAEAPAATPAPGAGAQADYVHLLANERLVIDLNQGVVTPAAARNVALRRVLIWAVGAGAACSAAS